MLKQIAPIVAAGLIGGITGSVLNNTATADTQAEQTLDVLNVKRINIVEDNGNYALVLGNSQSLPTSNVNNGTPGIREGIPGIIFYNNFGDEIGGLIYPASDRDWGYDGGVQLSMDQIKQSGQAIALRHWRNGDFVRSNLEITDYPTDQLVLEMHSDPEVQALQKKLREAAPEDQSRIAAQEYLPLLGEKGYFANRIFLGSEGRFLAKDHGNKRTAKLELKDSRSRPRIRLSVDGNDVPRIEILDETGKAVRTLIEEK